MPRRSPADSQNSGPTLFLMPRSVLLVIGLFSAFLPTSFAQSPAASGSLADYLNLPAEGVSLADGLVASNFQLLPRQNGAAGFRTQFIEVVPLDSGSSGRGFRLEVMDGATADDFFQLRLSFELTGRPLNAASVSMMTANLDDSSNAGLDTVLSLSTPGQPRVDLITFLAPGGAGTRSESKTFTARSPVTVELDIVLDGGGDGRPGEVVASVGSVRTFFQSPPRPPAPVPVVIEEVRLAAPDTLLILFSSAQNRDHLLLNSPDLATAFTTEVAPSGGSLMTDSEGKGRVEVPLTALGDSHFFSLQSVSP